MFANGDRSADPDHAVALAVAAEQAGYESLWAVQHVVMPVAHASRYPYSADGTVPGGVAVAIPDPLVWLAYVAAATSTIGLATGVLVLPQLNALVVAKQAATLDRLSRGRCLLGVGVGWLREEFEALGAAFEGRGARLDEQLAVLRAAWADDIVAHHGPTMTFAGLAVEPKPLGRRIPIIVGGHTPAAVRRAARLGDGFFPLGVRGAALGEMVGDLRRRVVEAGRADGAVGVTADAPRTPEEARVIVETGVERVVVNAPAVPAGALPDALAERLADVRRALTGA